MGGSVEVLGSPLGSGGQGEIYPVMHKGRTCALKWYTSSKIRSNIGFRENLRKNVNDGAPSPKFVWPLDITETFRDGYGYVMPLLPADHEVFSDILRTYKVTKSDPPRKLPVRFSGFTALANAALQIVESFLALHRAGKSYQDLNDGGIAVDTSSGDVLICDCDNIAADGCNFGIAGKQGYMAPEIVLGVSRPNVYSDRFSMAIILFKLLFRDDPFCGSKVLGCCNLTDYNYRKYYGENPVFIFDPKDRSNRPDETMNANSIKMWGHYPLYIRDLFIRAFCDGLRDLPARPIETDWISALSRLRSESFRCRCGMTSFAGDAAEKYGAFVCPRCGSEYPVLKIGDTRIVLTEGTEIFSFQIDPESEELHEVSARVVENRNSPGLFGFKNLSGTRWTAVYSDASKTIEPGGGAPLRAGMRIEFGHGVEGKVLRRNDDG